jgi:GTPase
MIAIFVKIDMAPEHITQKNIEELEKLLKGPGVNKTLFTIKTKRDVLNCCHNSSSGVIVPIIKISNVTGENLDFLKIFLNCLPP